MLLKDFFKRALEDKYLGKTILGYDEETRFVVKEVSVEDGGVDPQWQITLNGDSLNNREHYCLSFAEDEIPEILAGA